jgi:hypothetical protein
VAARRRWNGDPGDDDRLDADGIEIPTQHDRAF